MMDLSRVIAEFELIDVPDEWADQWETSLSSYPGEAETAFLHKHCLHEANNILKLSDGAFDALLETAGSITGNHSLCMLVWHCARMFNSIKNAADYPSLFFPGSKLLTGKFNGLINVIILLSGLDNALKLHRDRGISLKVTEDTFSDLRLWMNHYHRKYGRWGIEEQNWLAYHFTCRLFRLGRLQYIHNSFNGELMVFRNKTGNQAVALSAAGVAYRSDGQRDGTNGIFDETGSWISDFSADEACIIGNPISPFGYAFKNTVRLNTNEWQPVLKKGSPILDIHIPEGERLSLDLCIQSLHLAEEFYKTHFPEKDYYAFTCRTWLFDAQFQKILPPDSNIVKFQRLFYLYPILGSDSQTFSRVFGEKPEDLSKAPKDNTLRKAILEFLEGGNHLHDAGGFILPGDVGEDYYQKTAMY